MRRKAQIGIATQPLLLLIIAVLCVVWWVTLPDQAPRQEVKAVYEDEDQLEWSTAHEQKRQQEQELRSIRFTVDSKGVVTPATANGGGPQTLMRVSSECARAQAEFHELMRQKHADGSSDVGAVYYIPECDTNRYE